MATYDVGDQPVSWAQWKESLPQDVASLDKLIYDNVNNWNARRKQYARGKLAMLKAETELDAPPKKKQKIGINTSLNSNNNNNNNTNDTTTTQHTTTNQEHTQHTDTVTTTAQANNNSTNTTDTANNQREPSMSKSGIR